MTDAASRFLSARPDPSRTIEDAADEAIVTRPGRVRFRSHLVDDDGGGALGGGE